MAHWKERKQFRSQAEKYTAMIKDVLEVSSCLASEIEDEWQPVFSSPPIHPTDNIGRCSNFAAEFVKGANGLLEILKW